MPAKKFIDKLEAQGLLSPEIVEELRRQVQESKSRITPATLAKLLVENGHLTKFQATRLISEMSKDAPEKSASESPAAEKTSSSPSKSSRSKMDDELGLAPEVDASAKAPAVVILDDDDELTNDANNNVIEVVEVAEAVEDAADVELIDEGDEVTAVADVELADVELADVELADVELADVELADVELIDEPTEVVEVAEAVEVVEVADEPIEVVEVVDEPVEVVEVVEAVEEAAPRLTPKRLKKPEPAESKSGSKPKGKSLKELQAEKKSAQAAAAAKAKPEKSGKNPWDSHRITTVGVVLAVLLIAAGTLTYHFMRGNAEVLLKQAEEAYKPNNYEAAMKRYESFAASFPAHGQASFARVRAGMARVRRDIENLPDPTEALKTAENTLPALVKEPALSGERGDVADALVQLAQKFNQRADSAGETSVKKSLMTNMEKVNTMLADAQYVGNQVRTIKGVALKSIEEDRKRILRDISREEDLHSSLEKIDAALKENNTVQAYKVRSELLNRFPQLEKDAGVMARVQQAAAIQRSLVVPANPPINTSNTGPATPQTRTVTLANRTGNDVAALAGRTLCVAAKGTVYGLDGQTGNIKWRYFVGRDMSDDPVPVSAEPGADVIVARPDVGQVTRLESSTGKVKWFSDLGAPSHSVRVDGEDVLVALRSGTLISLETESGQMRWASTLPQPLQLTPMISADKAQLYVTGDHSNLYVLSRQDGKCKEVVYLGHREGTILVPPVHLLGQLFVFENRTSDRAAIRIFQTDDTGLNVTAVQDPVDVEGNIVTLPMVDRSQMLVVSDRGNMKVLDVQAASEKNKVSVIASDVGGEAKPTMFWGKMESNQVWMASNRFARWEVQVSTGKLVRQWIFDDGDEFVGAPQKFNDIVVHRRVVRGNRGVRVTAVRADSAAVQWMVDLGVPVALLASPAPGRFDAVLATGAQFGIDATQTLINQAESNTDSFKPNMTYDQPRTLGNGSVALVNNVVGNRTLCYVPGTGNKIRNGVENFGSARPTSPPGVVGDHLAVGLDNGQLLVIDPATGSVVSKPFQPPVEPGKKHFWSQPVYQAETKSLYATDNRRKLYRFSVGESLRALSDTDVEGGVLGPLATAGKQVALVLTNQTEESLLTLDGSSLAKSGSAVLDGRWLSGPFNIDAERVLVQTDRKLQMFGAGSAKIWEIDFPRVKLCAPPVVGPTGIALAATSGQAWLVDPATGSIKHELNVDMPLSAAPLAVPGGMLLGTDEGTVLLMRLTDSVASVKGSQ